MADLYERLLESLRTVVNEVSLEEFRDWFAPISVDVEQTDDHDVIQLVYQIDGVLSESSSGHWPLDVLLQELSNLVHIWTRTSGRNQYGEPSKDGEGSYPESYTSSGFTLAAA
jgi:hypothetical protein